MSPALIGGIDCGGGLQFNWMLSVNLKSAFRLRKKAGQRMIAHGCQMQCCLAERRPPFEERFAVCDEHSALGQTTRLVVRVGKIWRPRQRLGAGFYSHKSYPKTLGGSGNADAKHAFETAWQAM